MKSSIYTMFLFAMLFSAVSADVFAIKKSRSLLVTENAWQTKTRMPTERWNICTCTIDDKIYALGDGGMAPVRLTRLFIPSAVLS